MKEGALAIEYEELSKKDRYNEYVMTGLRTIWGVSLVKIEQDYGIEYLNYIKKQSKKYVQEGLLFFKGETLLPIIPDMNMLLKGIDSKEESLKYTIPDFPQIPKSAINVLKKGMRKRIIAIVDVFTSVKNMTWWKKILISLPFGFFKILRWALARPLAKKAVSFITDELGKYGFIEGVEPEELIKRKKKSST